MPVNLYPLPASLDEVHQRAEEIVARQREAYAAVEAMEPYDRPRRYSAADGCDMVVWPDVPTVEEVADCLRVEMAKVAAFRASPRGRFWSVIEELEAHGDARSEQLRGFYNRDITLLNGPEADVTAVTKCIRILNEIGTSVGRAGIAALADLLEAQAPARAA